MSVANDGLLFPLIGENAWCFPPEALIQRLLAKLVREQATITLMAPLRPSKPWWPELQALRIDRPIVLSPGAAVPQNRGPQQVFRIPALESGYVEDLRLALEDLGISDATISLTCKGDAQVPQLLAALQAVVHGPQPFGPYLHLS